MRGNAPLSRKRKVVNAMFGIWFMIPVAAAVCALVIWLISNKRKSNKDVKKKVESSRRAHAFDVQLRGLEKESKRK